MGRDCFIYMVTYEGQTESPYTWAEGCEYFAEKLKKELEAEYPDRVWSICEKDVS